MHVLCKSVEEMLDRMCAFCKWTGATVLAADDHNRLMFGYSAFYVEDDLEHNLMVEMPACEAIVSLREMRPERARLIEECLKSQDGRIRLAASIPGSGRRDQPPTFTCPRCGRRTWVPDFDPIVMHPQNECDQLIVESVMES